MFEMHLISGATDGKQGCELPPGKLNVKIGSPHLACILAFTSLLVFSSLLFFYLFRSRFFFP